MKNSKSDNCHHCSKPKTLHLTQVIDGKVIKKSVCPDCHSGKGLTEGIGFDLIEGTSPAAKYSISSDSTISCPDCGLTPKDFKERGRLGCSGCYNVYEEKLLPLYRKLHNGAEHLGKVPGTRKREVSPDQLKALRVRMDEHVSREEYELAAVVRDQIKSLEN